MTNRITEIIKCKDDFEYFCETYIGFKLTDRQKEIHSFVSENRHAGFYKERAEGATTLIVAQVLHYIIFNREKDVFFCNNKVDRAKDNLFLLKSMYQNLPEFLKVDVLGESNSYFGLANGVCVYATGGNPDYLRGHSISYLVLDEAGEFGNDFFEAVLPVVLASETSRVVASSSKVQNLKWLR